MFMHATSSRAVESLTLGLSATLADCNCCSGRLSSNTIILFKHAQARSPSSRCRTKLFTLPGFPPGCSSVINAISIRNFEHVRVSQLLHPTLLSPFSSSEASCLPLPYSSPPLSLPEPSLSAPRLLLILPFIFHLQAERRILKDGDGGDC